MRTLRSRVKESPKQNTSDHVILPAGGDNKARRKRYPPIEEHPWNFAYSVSSGSVSVFLSLLDHLQCNDYLVTNKQSIAAQNTSFGARCSLMQPKSDLWTPAFASFPCCRAFCTCLFTLATSKGQEQVETSLQKGESRTCSKKRTGSNLRTLGAWIMNMPT